MKNRRFLLPFARIIHPKRGIKFQENSQPLSLDWEKAHKVGSTNIELLPGREGGQGSEQAGGGGES